MKSFAFVLLNIIFASSEEHNSCHDDTLLIQTRAVAKDVRKTKIFGVHRYHITTHEDGVSLLQGHRGEAEDADVVYVATSTDNNGNSASTGDGHGGTIQTSGSFTLTNENG